MLMVLIIHGQTLSAVNVKSPNPMLCTDQFFGKRKEKKKKESYYVTAIRPLKPLYLQVFEKRLER